MLRSLDEPHAVPPRRPPRSPRQEYQEFILQRIEEYKNTITRDELLRIGDEAVRELEAGAAEQYLLTEVLLLEHVDRIIARRLRLPTFARWREKHRQLRAAQREPTHWGLDGESPAVPYARRLEPGDLVVVVGATALPEALFLAAHDAEVFLVDQDLGAIEAAEQRAITEQLAARFHALVVTFGSWLPEILPTLVVVEPRALAPARARERRAVIRDLQARTRPGGVHVFLAPAASPQVIPLEPQAFQPLYGGWQIERRGRRNRRRGFIAVKPERQADTAVNVSE